MENYQSKRTIEILALGAMLTALVFGLQFIGSFIRFGQFSISLVLIPIVIGAATCGKFIGAWLGLVFAVAVFLSGDAASFLVINAPGTIITVTAKGVLCGFLAGLVYEITSKLDKYFGVWLAAFVCPLVNTGVFLIGCRLFFYSTIKEWASAFGFGDNAVAYMFIGLAGINFLLELGVNLFLSPVIVRLIDLCKKMIYKK